LFKLDSFLGAFVLVKTKRLMSVLTYLSKKKFVDKIAYFGIAAGFGAFGLDYLYTYKKSRSIFSRWSLFILFTSLQPPEFLQ
jgi:hypothetical protein